MCPLCNKSPQTLIHILNACPVALNQRRYNVRHDSVLASLAKMVEKHPPTTASMSADLPGVFNFPLHVAPTSLRPDIVLWDDTQRWIYLVELTICFETSFEDAVKRKEDRYFELVSEAVKAGYSAETITVEIGYRGLPNINGLNQLKHLLQISQKVLVDSLIELSKLAILGSHSIWCTRNSITSQNTQT